MLIDTRHSSHARVFGLSQADVRWDAGFWQDRFDTCADVTIPHVLKVFDDPDSFFHQVENFRIAAGVSDGEFRGTPYGDGDFYKLMEGLIYAYAVRGDAATGQKLDAYVALIAKAQQPDGYLSTKQIIGERSRNGAARHGDENDFEEYNFGHLFTAACMHKRVTGKDTFLDIAAGVARYLEALYERILREDKAWTAVCPSHYMGLIELYRTTGNPKYLELAKTAIALRDRVKNGTDDNQDRLPLKKHREITGHGVRSTYLYAGVADLYLETGDETLLPVLNGCWQDLVTKKLYINCGCGALYTGTSPFGNLFTAQYVHQAFGYAYQLPNITAYNETCATIGSMLWASRMFAIDPKAQYMDHIERSCYNLVLAAVSLSGDRYFYENMLRRTKTLDYTVMWPVKRESFFQCFCCPTNISRTLTQVSEYAYNLSEDSVYTGVYGASTAKIRLPNGAAFTLRQATEYPWDGAITFTFADVRRAEPFTLKVRVPSWARGGTIVADGVTVPLTPAHADTFVDVRLTPDARTAVSVRFDMPAFLTRAHAKVEETENHVCVQRGPLLYCAESADAAGGSLDDLLLYADAGFTPVPCEVDGTPVIALETEAVRLQTARHDPDALYQQLEVEKLTPETLRLIPYFAWDNRGFGEMRVWFPVMYRA
ncbi:MAG: beta-L-arabinofuranosidase domain-containing protein [Bacillota bacterium]